MRGAARLALAAGLTFAGIGSRAVADNPLTVGVRSVVNQKRPATGAATKTYAFLAVQLVSSETRLVKPVDGAALLSLVRRGVSALGYRPTPNGQTPDILLTIQYGRGWLSNPYRGGNRDIPTGVETTGGDSGFRLDQLRNQSILGATTQLMDEKGNGYEEKIQRAGYEKLYLQVMAWEYPADSKAKTRMLWKTTMVVDDPDHRDLNLVAPQMLAAGASYFDRDVPEGEIEVNHPVPDGQVNVGTPEMVGPVAAPEKVAKSPAKVAAAPRVAREPTRKFDLPAGEASSTLQAFSQQSGEEIIYPAGRIRSIRTNGVSGELSVRAALDRMLANTGLVAVQDEKSGAFVIREGPR